MPKAIDYSKWNGIEDEECEENGTAEHFLERFQRFNALKLDADKLFAAAECSRDPYDYKVALNQGYLVSLEELQQISHNNQNKEEIMQLEVSCKLNSACCHLRLMEFQRTVDLCTNVLTGYKEIMRQDQIMRLRYFRGYSHCKLQSEQNLFLAESDAAEMQKILISLQTIQGPFAAEYHDFFRTLHENRQKFLLQDELIRSESEYLKSNMGTSVELKTGWTYYVQKKFALSSAWFASELLDLRKKSIDDPLNKELLCDRYCGYGKSKLALNNHIEARELQFE